MKLEKLFEIFLGSKNYELEARFGTRKYITRTHFDNVVNKLKSLGFKSMNLSGQYELRIMNELGVAKNWVKYQMDHFVMIIRSKLSLIIIIVIKNQNS